MVKINEKNFISFGEYLLSDERKTMLSQSSSSVPVEERMKDVSDADVKNWLYAQKKK